MCGNSQKKTMKAEYCPDPFEDPYGQHFDLADWPNSPTKHKQIFLFFV